MTILRNSFGRHRKRWSAIATAVASAGLILSTGCDDFLTVQNPDLIDASTLNGNDPLVVDVFARSAQSAFGSAYGDFVRFGALFTTEMQYTDTSEPEGQFAVRSVSVVNLVTAPTLWGPIASARVQSDRVSLLLQGTAEAGNSVNGARAALFAGYSMVFMAETFCEGTFSNVQTSEPGPRLTTAQVLDSAIVRFTSAIAIATEAAKTQTGAALAEANSFANAARVGRARANLQRGNRAQAASDAASVPAGFSFSMQFVDDAGNRTRVSNRLWQFTQARGQLSVAPAYRALADSRVAFLNPTASLPGFDGTQFFPQQKYPSYSSSIRLASKLEADYIAAEAQLPTSGPALAVIAARRAAGGTSAYTGGSDSASLVAELFDQRARDFFLEGHRLGDLVRATDLYKNPALIGYMLPTGSVYFGKTSLGAVGNQSCVPLPQTETSNNKFFNP